MSASGGFRSLVLVTLRKGFPRVTEPAEAKLVDGEQEHIAPVEASEMRLARGLFYLGILTLGESAFRVPPGLTPSQIAFILALASAALAALRGARLPRLPGPMLIAVGLFAFGGAISSVGAISPAGSTKEVLHGVYVLLLWPLLGAMVIRTREQLVIALGLWAVSGAIDGIAALSQLTSVHLPGTVTAAGRYQGFTMQQNDLGGVAAVGLTPAMVFAARGTLPTALWRLFVVALVVAALVLSGSVAGMAGAIVATVIWLSSPAARSRFPSRVAATVAVAALSSFGVLALAGNRVLTPTQRVQQVTRPGAGSANIRVIVAEAAWRRIKRDPIIGTGLDTLDTTVLIFYKHYPVLEQVHVLPIAAWYEAGIFGLIGILGLLGCITAIARRMLRQSRFADHQIISWALLGSLAAFLVEVMTGPMVFQVYAWVAPVMVVSWSAIVTVSEKRTSPGNGTGKQQRCSAMTASELRG